MTPQSVGIVGAGVLGMTLALRLRQQGHRVTVIEAASPGGLAAAQTIGGYRWDRFYHVILQSDTQLRGILEELGLAHHLRWGVTRTGFWVDGRLHSLSNSWEFVRFPPLNLVDKARLALTIVHASRLKDWRALEAEPVSSWLKRWSGRRTYERIWLPLLKSKLGENYTQASAAFIWAIIARMYAARRAGLKREMFGYVEGGYDVVISRFRDHLTALGVEFLCGSPVTAVTGSASGAQVVLAGGGTRDFDEAVLTVSTAAVQSLCPQLTGPERDRLGRVVYQGVVCASVLVRKPLAGFYVTNITDPTMPFTAVIEMTSLVDRRAFGGHTLLYLPRYLTASDPYWQRTDAEIRADFLPALMRMHPGLAAEDVLDFQVSRAREVMALATLHYSDEAMPPVRTSVPHVSLANSAQIANGTLNVNETVRVAESAAQHLVSLWASRTPSAGVPAGRA